MRVMIFALAVFGMVSHAGASEEFTTLKGHGGPIMGLAVDPDGRVASASFDNSVGLWTEEGTPKWLEGHDAAVTAIVIGPEGQILSGGDDFAVLSWDGVPQEDSAPQEIGRHKGKVTALAIDPDGDFVASGSWDGDIRLWSLPGGEASTLDSPGSGVNDVALSPDGATLFAATSGGVIWRYDLNNDNSRRPLARHGFGINRMIAGEGWIAYGAVDGGTRVIDSDSGEQIADFTLDRRPILSMAYYEPAHQLVVGDGHGYIMMVDSERWKITRDFRAMRRGPVWALAFSPNGKTVYAGGLDDVIYAWPVALLDEFDPAPGEQRSFLRAPATMANGERQFMRKCSICHSLESGPSRKAGPSLHDVFGRRAGDLPDYRYSKTLTGSKIIWSEQTINALFDEGPDHYIPGSKMPMQVIADPADRDDLIDFLKSATQKE